MGVPMTVEEIVGELEDGMRIGIGGWGSRRKPMALVRAICRSARKDLTVVSCGGPDVGLLCAAGKVRALIAPFVTLDSIPLEPHFRRARQAQAIEFTEYDEGMFMFGLLAAAHRLPFLPTRAGLGSDVLTVNKDLRTVRSPYGDGDGEELVAVPALTLDVALVHMDVADTRGNGRYLGPDPYLDDLFAKAAARTYLSAERLVPPGELGGPPQSLLISRMHVTGVTQTPGGAHFTETGGVRDEAFQRHYAEAAGDEQRWGSFRSRFLDGDEAAYQRAVREWHQQRTAVTR